MTSKGLAEWESLLADLLLNIPVEKKKTQNVFALEP